MNKINVLFVEDREEDLRIIETGIQRHMNRVRFLPARSKQEALDVIRDNFLSVAFVDLCLKENTNNLEGQEILALLRDRQPQCERIVYSEQHASPTVVDHLFRPGNELATAVLDKRDAGNSIELFLDSKNSLIGPSPIHIEALSELAHSVNSRVYRNKASVQFIEDEIFFLFQKAIFDQFSNVALSEKIKIELTVEAFSKDEEGKSLSYVGKVHFRTIFETSSPQSGITAVVKIGVASEILEEVARFRSFIATFVANARRVEVLGWSTAANLGIILYSFAGSALSRDLIRLNRLISDDPERATTTIKSIFEAKDLHAVSTTPRSMFEFIQERFISKQDDAKLDPRTFPGELRKLVEQIVKKSNGQLEFTDNKLRTRSGAGFAVPTDPFSPNSLFRGQKPYCISHGDLHSGNVFVGNRDEVVLIDYRHTGSAPRCLDFAAMDASIRTESKVESSLVESITTYKTESDVWQLAWGKSSQIKEYDKKLATLPHWGRTSVQLLQTLQSVHSGVTQEEYAATVTVWVTRLLTLRIELEKKTRLLSWLAFVYTKQQ